jgi:ABC-type phosphate transport system substrate-binding protein
MVHLPFVLGAISIFHNIPNVPEGSQGLNLTACTLSKIFKRDIKYWDDAEILETNPGLKDKLPPDDYPITVSRRVHGSSSTASVTQVS